MKHQTPDLMKFKRLQKRLGETKRGTVGLLELLWIETQKNCPAGDVGKYLNEEIGIMLDWHGDADELVAVLVECGWLDESDEHRLLVHDWPDHVPNYLKASFARYGKQFAAATSQAGCLAPSQAATPNVTQSNPTQPNRTEPSPTNVAESERDGFVGLRWKGMTADERSEAERIGQRIALVVPISRQAAKDTVCEIAVRAVLGDLPRSAIESALASATRNKPKDPAKYFAACVNNSEANH